MTPWTAARQASLTVTNSWSLFKLMSIEAVMPSNHLILCHPLLLPSIFPSIRVFSDKSGGQCWSFSFRLSPSNEYSGLISFRTDGFDLLAVQWTLKSLLQYHSSKATLWTAARQAPLSMGSSWQEYWSGLPCPPPAFDLHSIYLYYKQSCYEHSCTYLCWCKHVVFFFPLG